MEAREEVQNKLLAYVCNFNDNAYVGVIETDELTVEEEEISQDIFQLQ